MSYTHTLTDAEYDDVCAIDAREGREAAMARAEDYATLAAIRADRARDLETLATVTDPDLRDEGLDALNLADRQIATITERIAR